MAEFMGRIINNPYIPHVPYLKQLMFLLLDDREAFYGGAAAGGKSDALLMAALMYVQEPGYHAIIFRRTYTDLSLPGALMDRAREWLEDTDARWIDKEKTWRFPSGSTLTFGYMEKETDKYRYKSSEFQFIGWDELTQFSKTQYLYMFSRCRSLEGFPFPLRIRSASNPGDVGHDHVKERFITPYVDLVRDQNTDVLNLLELYSAIVTLTRPFVPAYIKDNIHVKVEEYIENLKELDATERERLLNGDWNITEGGKKFKRFWFEIVEDYPRRGKTVRFWDLAATLPKKPGQDPDYTAGAKVHECDGIYYILDIKRMRDTPGSVERLIAQTASLDGYEIEIGMEQEPGSSGVKCIDDYRRRVLKGYNFKGFRSTGSKEVRAGPVSSAAEAGNVKLLRGPWNSAFLDEAEQFPTQGVHDDQVDGISGAFGMIRKSGLIVGNINGL